MTSQIHQLIWECYNEVESDPVAIALLEEASDAMRAMMVDYDVERHPAHRLIARMFRRWSRRRTSRW